MANTPIKQSVRALLAEIVDYAGLFPPSQLPMNEAVANYARYKNSSYSWMLGRFVVPVARLEEFADEAKVFFKQDGKVWKLSVLASEDIYETVRGIKDFNTSYAPNAVCDALEVKANTGELIKEIAASIPSQLKTYFEIPIDESLADSVLTLATSGQRAKIRTGGVTADAFPTAEQIARFMQTCLAANVPFKATAGLHHPLRCTKPLTYEKDTPRATMHGFLNVFLAAGFLLQGCKIGLINELLGDESAQNFIFDENSISWREHSLNVAQLKNLRTKNIISFGSCSFDEPIADLISLNILN